MSHFSKALKLKFKGPKIIPLFRELNDMRGLCVTLAEIEFFIDNLLVRIHFIIVMIRWTGLAPWKYDFPFPVAVAVD